MLAQSLACASFSYSSLLSIGITKQQLLVSAVGFDSTNVLHMPARNPDRFAVLFVVPIINMYVWSDDLCLCDLCLFAARAPCPIFQACMHHVSCSSSTLTSRVTCCADRSPSPRWAWNHSRLLLLQAASKSSDQQSS